MEDVRQKQQRPSVLCQVSQTASRHHVYAESGATVSSCKEEADKGHHSQSSLPQMSSSLMQSLHLLPVRRDSPKQSSIEARLHDGIPDGTSALFVSGLCRWPGCDTVTKDFPSFLKHLHSEHSHGDRSIAQWRVQQDIVQCMESQLILEKQKLIAMQLHLHLFEHADLKAASQSPYSLPLFLPQPQVSDGNRVQQWCIKHMEELSQQSYTAPTSVNLLPDHLNLDFNLVGGVLDFLIGRTHSDWMVVRGAVTFFRASTYGHLIAIDLVPSLECYKYNNIRPPYTYAYLIRWSILESPDKQRTLNEIYNWFTTMFFYFRHNTATWKNAVRHNLSLHKCFVRVEGGKGAVWTVDETEYQRRKGQKYHRDCPVKWLTSYSHHCLEDH